jgi:predicted pyridoxine 5'-phosphate oxidase superfamily flavin-nucleotide-binding protein
MAYTFGSLVFTPVVQALQERYGSRRQYARREASGVGQDGLGEFEREFLKGCDSFYMASVGATGWPYVQHRGGPKGFLKIIDEHTIAFADFRGNKQFVSTGNLMTDNRVALILVDYPRQARLKILGHVKILEGVEAKDWDARLREPGYYAVVERAFVIHVAAFDWNCQQHITPRFTEEQIRSSLAPIEKQMHDLEQENERLKSELALSNRESKGVASRYPT